MTTGVCPSCPCLAGLPICGLPICGLPICGLPICGPRCAPAVGKVAEIYGTPAATPDPLDAP